jgi:hypothetical protein
MKKLILLYGKSISLAVAELLLLSFIFTLTSCDKDDQAVINYPLSPADDFSRDEYAIYALALNSYSDSTIVVLQKTNKICNVSEPDFNEKLKVYSLFNESLKVNYLQNNTGEYYLGDYINLKDKEPVLYSWEQFKRLTSGGDSELSWDNFYLEQPGSKGIFRFNKIGFNDQNTSAVLEVTQHHNKTDITVSVVYLEKVDGKWSVIEHFTL